MNLKKRMAMANACKAIAEAAGAQVEILPCGILGTEPETMVTITFADIKASFDIGGITTPIIVISWYEANRNLRLNHNVFGSINEFHKRKATTTVSNDGMLDYLTRACEAVKAGDIFEVTA
jgi:hypothetical protein